MSLDRHIDLAYKVAALSECSMQHGAVIVRGGNILSIACNRRVTHPVSKGWAKDPKQITTIHAEQRALILCKAPTHNATLISVRLNGDKRSRACRMCRALCYDAGIHTIVYFDGTSFVKERL